MFIYLLNMDVKRIDNINYQFDASKLERVAEILKTLSHPVRLSVLQSLQKEERLSVSELIVELGIEQSLLSHHLTKMKDKGILKSEREGKNIYYSLADITILKIFECMGSCGLIN